MPRLLVRDVAAYSGAVTRAEIERKHQSEFFRCPLRLAELHAGLCPHRAPRHVHAFDRIHRLERQHDVALLRIGALDEASEAAVCDDRLTARMTQSQHRRHLFGGSRPHE